MADEESFRRLYFERLKEQRSELEPKTSLIGPVIGAGLTGLSIGLAIAGVSISAPLLSVLGLAVALAGVPMTAKALVERGINVERLRKLDLELDQIDAANAAEIEARERAPE